jgi:hypothetical protein
MNESANVNERNLETGGSQCRFLKEFRSGYTVIEVVRPVIFCKIRSWRAVRPPGPRQAKAVQALVLAG